jgi:hypothetical protein
VAVGLAAPGLDGEVALVPPPGTATPVAEAVPLRARNRPTPAPNVRTTARTIKAMHARGLSLENQTANMTTPSSVGATVCRIPCS